MGRNVGNVIHDIKDINMAWNWRQSGKPKYEKRVARNVAILAIREEPHSKWAFAFRFSFDKAILEFCRYIRETCGNDSLFYDAEGRCWRFNDYGIVDMICSRFPEVNVDPETRTKVDNMRVEKEKQEAMNTRREILRGRKESDLVINGVKGTMFPYQKLATEFLVESRGRGMLALQQGTGKTLCSLAYAAHTGKERVLVVCPASVKWAWESETKKWTNLKPLVISSQSSPREFERSDIQVFIVNYDVLKKFEAAWKKTRFDLLIGDECTLAKATTSIRAKMFKYISRMVPEVILLSGTPMLNRPVELFNLLNIMNPYEWKDWWDFTKRYCAGHQGPYGWDSKGASNLDELKKRISPYFLRMTKEEVLPDLPPKLHSVIEVDLGEQTMDLYKMALNDLFKYLVEEKKKEKEDAVKSMGSEALVRLNELRMIVSKGKLPFLLQMLKESKELGDKVVVFSVYTAPLEEMHEALKDCSVILTGKSSDQERKEAIEKFQTDPNCLFFFGGMRSAGVGITLTAASNVYFLDYSWVPADHEQAEDRAHRIGTKSCVNVRQFSAKGTIDSYLQKILNEKKHVFSKLIENGAEEKATISSLIQELESNGLDLQPVRGYKKRICKTSTTGSSIGS